MANTTVNYEDKRLTDVEDEKKTALSDVEKTYGGMISGAGKFYDKQIDAVEQYGDKQAQLQQQQTDFALEKIEQQKDQAHKDYIKEQSGAYTDYAKQSNQYGAGAEQRAAQGLAGSGYSESAQVSMYNTWQQRVVANRELYQKAVLDYDNQMNEARLQNSAALAEIAFNTLKEKLQLGLEGFQYENQLIIEKADKKLAVGSEYHSRYMDVLGQINEENRLAEEQRQFDRNYEEGVREFNKDYEEGVRQFNEELNRLKQNDRKEYELALKQLEEEQRQFDAENSSAGGGILKDSGDTGSKISNMLKNAAGKIKEGVKNMTSSNVGAADYFNQLVASGASEDKVLNEITLALREGAITEKEAQELRNKFTLRGAKH